MTRTAADRAQAVLVLLDALDTGSALTSDACRAVRLALGIYRWSGLLDARVDDLHLGVGLGDRVHFLLTHDASRLDEVISSGNIEAIAADLYRLNIIGDAFSRNEDPDEAKKFVAHEVLPGDDAKAKGRPDPEACFFDEPAAVEPAATQRVRRVIRGNEMSDDELNRVVSADQGARFTLADGAVFRIVVPGQTLPLDLTNVVPMRRGARG